MNKSFITCQENKNGMVAYGHPTITSTKIEYQEMGDNNGSIILLIIEVIFCMLSVHYTVTFLCFTLANSLPETYKNFFYMGKR